MAETFEQWWNRAGIGWVDFDEAEMMWNARDAEIAELRAEIERLKRPEMTRELPQKNGYYFKTWFGKPNRVTIVQVEYYAGCWRVRDIGGIGDWEFLVNLKPCYWSARPIEPDPMPEGGGK